MAGHGKHPILDSNPGIKIAGKGTGKKNKIGKQARNDTDTVERPKCNLCEGPHRTLISCPKLPQYIRLTLDIGCIITLGVICVFLTGFMWYHVEFKDYQFPSWLTDKN